MESWEDDPNVNLPNNERLRRIFEGTDTAAPNIEPIQNPQENSTDNATTAGASGLESLHGNFGWVYFGGKLIAYIFRAGVKYVSAYDVNVKVFNQYLKFLNPNLYVCNFVRATYATPFEVQLLNDINMKVCNGQYVQHVFTGGDLLVKLHDTLELYFYSIFVYHVVTFPAFEALDRRGGLISINTFVVPFINVQGVTYLPSYFFRFLSSLAKAKLFTVERWEFQYLKFCCRMLGLRPPHEIFTGDSCPVITLQDAMLISPPGLMFTEMVYYSREGLHEDLLVSPEDPTSAWYTVPPWPYSSLNGGLSINVNHGGLPSQLVPFSVASFSPQLHGTPRRPVVSSPIPLEHNIWSMMPSALPVIEPPLISPLLTPVSPYCLDDSLSPTWEANPVPHADLAHPQINADETNEESELPGQKAPLDDVTNVDSTQSTTLQPFVIKNILLGGVSIPVVNTHPYEAKRTAMTLKDFAESFLPGAQLNQLIQLIEEREQKQVLESHNVAITKDTVLIETDDVMKYLQPILRSYYDLAYPALSPAQ